MNKIFTLFAAVLFAGSMMAETATLTAGTNGSAAKVNEQDAIKVGTSKAGGDMTVTVGAGAKSLTLYAAAWKGTSQSLTITVPSGVTITPASIDLTADDGISSNSPFTLEGTESSFKFEFEISGATTETAIKFEGSKRFVVWNATYEAEAVTDPVIGASDVDLGTVIFDGDEYTVEFEVPVTAANLTEDIDVSTNVGSHLSFASTTIPSSGGSLIVTVTAGAGELDDQIVLISGTATKTVNVTGHLYERVVNPGTSATVAVDSNGYSNYFVNDVPAIKIGTGKKIGDVIINIPTEATKLYFFAAAWTGTPGKAVIEGKNVTLSSTAIVNDSISLLADAGIMGTDTAYFTKEGDWTKYQFVIDLSNVTSGATVTITSTSAAKRFVIWDVTYTTGSTTGLEATKEEQQVVKFFENGQLLIRKGDKTYNALGEVVK